MSDKLREAEAVRAAEEVLDELQLRSLPIDPFEIARVKGIEVVSKDSDDDGVSGFLMRSGDIFGIMYASNIKNEGFIRFTIAHELGHYFLAGHVAALFPNGDGVHASRVGFVDADPFERQADHFASALLMPLTLIKQELNELGCSGFAAIQALAAKCKTSITATAINYAKFCDDPVAVVVSSGSRVLYCFMSDCLREFCGRSRLQAGDSIPNSSATSKFIAVPSNISSARSHAGYTSLDDWFEGARQLEMKEDVIGLGGYGRVLTVLFADELPEDEVGTDENE